MYKTYFKQALQMLRQNPFISVMSILGTAFAIMMIMVIIVSDNIGNVEIKPEVNRGRTYYSSYFVVRDTTDNRFVMSGGLNYSQIRDYFYTMKVPEAVSAYQDAKLAIVSREGERTTHKTDMRMADDAYWKIFSFDFIEGGPFTSEEFDAGIRRAVIDRTTARTLFKGEKAVGKTMLVDHVPYTVSGVVRDVSPIFGMAYGQVWIPYSSRQGFTSLFGFTVAMMAKDPADHPLIAEEMEELERRYLSANAPRDIDFGTALSHAGFARSNWDTISYDESLRRNRRAALGRALLFMVLVLVPALNLSGFSVSRMKKRIEEIGVRKAFGARTGTVLVQVLYENVITSLIGGLIGLVLTYTAIFLMKGWLLGVDAGAAIPFRALVSPWLFGVVIVLCVLFGVISSGIPALNAARKKIVDSLSKNNR